MTGVDAALNVGLGLASSLHCAQMCGPIVLAYSLRSPVGWQRHVLYNAGRVATYSLLGALAGLAGTYVTTLGKWAGVARGAALAGGIALIVAGVLTTGAVKSAALVNVGAGAPLRWLSRGAGRLLGGGATSKLALGALIGFLPCGLVYAALLKSMAAEGPLDGALTMALFGAGTSVPLLALGAFSSLVGPRLRRYSAAVASCSMFLLGGILLWHGLRPFTIGLSCHLP